VESTAFVEHILKVSGRPRLPRLLLAECLLSLWKPVAVPRVGKQSVAPYVPPAIARIFQ
jgi:hypothetical protein